MDMICLFSFLMLFFLLSFIVIFFPYVCLCYLCDLFIYLILADNRL